MNLHERVLSVLACRVCTKVYLYSHTAKYIGWGHYGRDHMVVGFTTTVFVPVEEEFEDTKGAIRIRTSKKNRQHNDQKKEYKRTNNSLQNIHIKLKID